MLTPGRDNIRIRSHLQKEEQQTTHTQTFARLRSLQKTTKKI